MMRVKTYNNLMTIPGKGIFLLFLALLLLVSCHPDPAEPRYEPETITVKGRIIDVDAPVAIFIPGSQWLSTDKDGYFQLDINLEALEEEFPLELYASPATFPSVLFKELDKESLLNLHEEGIYDMGDQYLNLEKEETTSEEKAEEVKGKVELENKDKYQGILVLIEELGRTTTTNQEGKYFFTDIPVGNYTFHYMKDSFEVYTMDNVNIPFTTSYEIDSIRLEEEEIEEPDRKGTIRGQVRLVSVEGRVMREASGINVDLLNTPHEVETDRRGNFEFENIEYGNYFLKAELQGFDTYATSVYLSSPELSLPTIRLEEDEAVHYGSIQGSIIYPNEEADFSIVALKGTQAVSFADRQGRYQLEEIQPGTYDLIIKAEGFKPKKLSDIEVKPNVMTNIPAVQLEIVEDPPKVLSTLPADGQKDIRVEEKIESYIIFSTKMDLGRTKEAISISPSVSHDIYMGREHSRSDWDTAVLVLYAGDVSQPLEFNTTYTVSVDKNASDLDNQKMEDDYEFTFTTGRGRILRTSPRDGETNVGIRAYNIIEVYFNCKIDTNTFERAFRISPSPADRPTFNFYETDEGWTVAEIEVSLDHDTDYTITLDNRLRSWDRTSLENTPYSIEFDTYFTNEY